MSATMNAADTAWIITASALVLFMTLPGLALFYGGLVRSRNALSVLIQCFGITALASLAWVAVGYGLAFGDGGSAQGLIGSLDKAFLGGVTAASLTGTLPEPLFMLFQMTFAIITPALVIGAYAERTRFAAVLCFSVLWLLLVYVPITHWVWGGGWLAKLGVMDFAGGIVVHVNAGMAALVCAKVIGNRRGFPQVPMPPHNLPLVATGAGMLWIGWFGFNGGSALAANGQAAMAIVATHLGACAGALAWMLIEWRRYGKPSLLGLLTGVVAGLGTITPASGFVSPMGAIAIGFLAGGVCFFATQLLKRVLHIDDSLDVSPVHGVGGVLGSLLTGVFAATALGGTGFTVQQDIASQLGVQALGIAATMAWCGVATWLILKVLDRTVGLRVAEDEESEGLDLAEHGERGYIP
jgi:ammonium transporter, Amt family